MIVKFDGVSWKQMEELLRFLQSEENELKSADFRKMEFRSGRNCTRGPVLAVRLISATFTGSSPLYNPRYILESADRMIESPFRVALLIPKEIQVSSGGPDETGTVAPIPRNFFDRVYSICGG